MLLKTVKKSQACKRKINCIGTLLLFLKGSPKWTARPFFLPRISNFWQANFWGKSFGSRGRGRKIKLTFYAVLIIFPHQPESTAKKAQKKKRIICSGNSGISRTANIVLLPNNFGKHWSHPTYLMYSFKVELWVMQLAYLSIYVLSMLLLGGLWKLGDDFYCKEGTSRRHESYERTDATTGLFRIFGVS